MQRRLWPGLAPTVGLGFVLYGGTAIALRLGHRASVDFRAEAKDYRDVAAILQAGGDLAAGLAAATALYGPSFQPAESLRALVFFRDGDLSSLSEQEQRVLVKAASAVRELPGARIVSRTLSAATDR